MAVQWGILSTARINDRVLAAIAASPLCEAAAVASRDEDRARDYARGHGIPRAYGGYQTLLADPGVEAVYISAPNALHGEWTRRALEAGKHVLCEKPLSRSAELADSLFDVAERAGRLLSEAFMYRHHPQTSRLRELVDGGAIGSLALIRASFSFPIGDPGDVRLSAELDGGALMDVGCYCVSAARLLAGEPASVNGWQTIGGDRVDVAFVGVLEHEHGVISHFDAGIELAQRHELEVVGDQATLLVSDPWLCDAPGIELRRGGECERIAIPAADPYRLEVDNLAAAIRGEGEALLGRRDAVGQARAIEALYAAAADGGPVKVVHGEPAADGELAGGGRS
ncbi:MAG: Gfo/Idh/MocA family protein [Solirubrobacteraceae bacterium]